MVSPSYEERICAMFDSFHENSIAQLFQGFAAGVETPEQTLF